MKAIANVVGISGITEEEYLAGKGNTLLFNLIEDPAETNDLSDDPDYADMIDEFKATIWAYVKVCQVCFRPTSDWFDKDDSMSLNELNVWPTLPLLVVVLITIRMS